MQVRDLMEQLQQFEPRSSVAFEVSAELRCSECDDNSAQFTATLDDCEIKRGPDTARIVLS